jgi:hypothetical protein
MLCTIGTDLLDGRMKKTSFYILLFNLLLATGSLQAEVNNTKKWGLLANPGFDGQSIKSTLFFTGNSRNGKQYYEYTASPNINLYSIHPKDKRHLKWSESISNMIFAVDKMIEAGINVINMSYWGERGLDRWTKYAPMQTSTFSNDELFYATMGRNILIVPFIESTDEWKFIDEFPGTPASPSPGLVSQIKDLIHRYIKQPNNKGWMEKWAQAYDQHGVKRYIVSIIHVASNQNNIDDKTFSLGFDWVAKKILDETGILIGFTLDMLPPNTNAPGTYKPSPDKIGPLLRKQPSIIAIQCFIPEIWLGISDEKKLIIWKRMLSKSWIQTGIPFILDVTPGYDAHKVFPKSVVYGNNNYWRSELLKMIEDLDNTGVTFNVWNGYTEGFSGVQTKEFGNINYKWAKKVFRLR